MTVLRCLSLLLLAESAVAFNVLIIGGSRFSGAYLWKELNDRGHDVTVYNRGKTQPKPVARESESSFQARIAATTALKGDRKDAAALKELIDPTKYDYVFDMNAREVTDTQPLAELFVGQPNFKQYVFMSSAGVYLKSDEMPHLERDPVDPKSRHKGKLDSENCLKELGLPWCSFRPTYICGPQNYNPVERYFFERVDAGRPVCIPMHGQHLTGLGHVEDLAVAMANIIGREDKTTGKVYNIQNTQAVTFDGVAKAAGKVLGKEVEIIHYNPKEFTFPEGKKVSAVPGRLELFPPVRIQFLDLCLILLFDCCLCRHFPCAPNTSSQVSTKQWLIWIGHPNMIRWKLL